MISPALPTVETLKPFLAKLEAEPRGAIMIGITYDPIRENFCHVGTCFLGEAERKKLKAGLQGINRSRRAKGQPETSEHPGNVPTPGPKHEKPAAVNSKQKRAGSNADAATHNDLTENQPES